MLRGWRTRRRLSQLDLACAAEVSTRHLSFLETGRARPSREMVLRLAERLEIPLRDRNAILLAAGHAPAYPERRMDDPGFAPAREAIERLLEGHVPYPALAIDRRWNMVLANRMIPPLLEGVAEALLRPPVNVLRLSLHPEGLAPRIANLPVWRHALLSRLQREAELSGDPALVALGEELRAYPAPMRGPRDPRPDAPPPLAAPLELEAGGARLSLIGATTVFGTPADVTLSEIALETFFPADAASAEALRALAGPIPETRC